MRDTVRQDPSKMSEQQNSAAETPNGRPADPSRRRALAKLGLGTAAAYVAPSVLRIDRSAQAQLFPTPCPPPGGPPSSRPAHCPPGGGPPGGGPG